MDVCSGNEDAPMDKKVTTVRTSKTTFNNG